MTWIVTGGAGYIGAHVVHLLRKRNEVVVLDDLSTGRKERVPDDVALIEASVTDRAVWDDLLRRRRVDGVIHLAARKVVGESLESREFYEQENVHGVRVVVDAMELAGVRRLIFASSAAVYGEAGPWRARDARPVPANPYGRTKLDGEELIARAALQSVMFRQFNVIGAGDHAWAVDDGGTSLAPTVFRAVTGGPELVVRGADYPTRDGSAVRDYIHVDDVARTYATAVEQLMRRDGGVRHRVVDLATGRGTSVLEFVRIAGEVVGREVPHTAGERRPGDVAAAVAHIGRFRRLTWRPRPVADAIASAWRSWQAHLGSPTAS